MSRDKGVRSYILKQTWCPSVCMCGQKLGSAWKILPVTARSLLGQFVLAMGKKIPMDQSGAQGRAGVETQGQGRACQGGQGRAGAGQGRGRAGQGSYFHYRTY